VDALKGLLEVLNFVAAAGGVVKWRVGIEAAEAALSHHGCTIVRHRL